MCNEHTFAELDEKYEALKQLVAALVDLTAVTSTIIAAQQGSMGLERRVVVNALEKVQQLKPMLK